MRTCCVPRAVTTVAGFVSALPYGPNADCLENLVDRGKPILLHDGHAYPTAPLAPEHS